MGEDTKPFDDLGVSGLLTRSDREFLIGEKSYQNPGDERRARLRLRERIRNGFKDFILLSHHLEERDRDQLLRDQTLQISEPGEEFRDDELSGMVYSVAFMYALASEARIGFDDIIQAGVTTAMQVIFSDPFAASHVDVTIEDHHTVGVEQAIEKLRERTSITFVEYSLLLELLVTDTERLRAETRNVEIPTEPADGDDHYSLEDTFILAARYFGSPMAFRGFVDEGDLHPHLVDDLLGSV